MSVSSWALWLSDILRDERRRSGLLWVFFWIIPTPGVPGLPVARTPALPGVLVALTPSLPGVPVAPTPALPGVPVAGVLLAPASAPLPRVATFLRGIVLGGNSAEQGFKNSIITIETGSSGEREL